MKQITVMQTFQISAKTVKKYTEIMILTFVIQIIWSTINWFFMTSVLEGTIQLILFRLIIGVFLAFLVQLPIYLGIYSYLTGREFTRETIFETLKARAARFLLVILLQMASVVVFEWLLPELITLLGNSGWIALNALSLIGIYILELIFQFASLAILIWSKYLNMTILISEPKEKRMISKATHILFSFFGRRLWLMFAVFILIFIPVLLLMALTAPFLGELSSYVWVGAATFLMSMTDMAIFVNLLPGGKTEDRK